MIEITLNKQKYLLPEKWEEVTLRQYRDMVRHKSKLNQVRLLSIFTGIDFDVLNNFDCSSFDPALGMMQFMQIPFNPFELPRPTVLHILKKEIPVILDPGMDRLGQKLYMQQITNAAIANKADHVELVAPTLANYYQPKFDDQGRYLEDDLETFEEAILDMPVTEAYPEANFFLTGYIGYVKTKQPH